LVLSGSRGVIRADNGHGFVVAFRRLRNLLTSRDVRAERDPDADRVLIEGFIPGREYAIEALLTNGEPRVLAIFDKPDPLEGPLFEEQIYATPPETSKGEAREIEAAVANAARAIGLRHGPIHAECRLNDDGVFVLEVAARPIGGLCSRALRFDRDVSLEELLL